MNLFAFNFQRSAQKLALVLFAVMFFVSSCAGVRQKVIVTSDPPGADITMNATHLGKTPTETPFTWYWYYDFKAEQDGFDTEIKRERFHAPPYLWPGVDLVMEMMPFHVTDTKRVHFVMKESSEMPEPVYLTEAAEQ